MCRYQKTWYRYRARNEDNRARSEDNRARIVETRDKSVHVKGSDERVMRWNTPVLDRICKIDYMDGQVTIAMFYEECRVCVLASYINSANPTLPNIRCTLKAFAPTRLRYIFLVWKALEPLINRDEFVGSVIIRQLNPPKLNFSAMFTVRWLKWLTT